ncbi:hypothetical protein ACFL50_06670, partial [Candidatus Latescibacterota bacterium]
SLFIWISPFLEKQAEIKFKNTLKPDIIFDIREKSESQIFFSIQTTHRKTLIKTLSLKFDIPGCFKDYNLDKIERAGKFNINNSFSIGGQDTTAETIHVWCENLYPNSFVRARINYTPTLPRLIPGSEHTPYEEIYMPIMDLHDYSKCVYTWIFQGEEITETKYINLKNLEFIQKDNENLLYIYQGIDYEKTVRKLYPEYENPQKHYYTEEWLEKREEERKNW